MSSSTPPGRQRTPVTAATTTTPATTAQTSNDWRWQIKNRVTSLDALEARLPLTDDERAGVRAAAAAFAWGVTPYYLSLVDPANPDCPIRMQCIPRALESQQTVHELSDPLGEDTRMPVPGVVHRYPDRVLLLTTDRCAVYCRYCTRRRLVGEEERQLSAPELDAAVSYIDATPGVREVIVSGGDPLVSGDRFLDTLLARLAAIDHVETLRIHTRLPVVCPMRITPGLAEILRRHQPLFVITHFNHLRELTPAACAALGRLVDAGIPVGNQAVLLRGINDTAQDIEALCRALTRNRVWPYYLHQADLAAGTNHFRTPLRNGVEIIDTLRGQMPGYAIPTLVIDLPDGGGKVPLSPEYVVAEDGDTTTFRAPLGGTRVVPTSSS